MKLVVWISVLIVVNFVLGQTLSFLPWWFIAISALLVGYLSKLSNWQNWVVGFLSVFVLWVVYAFSLDASGGALLSKKFAELFAPITGGSVIVLFLLVGLVGGLVSAFAALTGSLLRNLFSKG